MGLGLILVQGSACSCGGGDDGGTPDGGGGTPDATGGTADAAPAADATPTPDAAPIPVMSITDLQPRAASRQVDATITVFGFNLVAGATVVLENCDTGTTYDVSSTVVVSDTGRALTFELLADPSREQGLYTVTVTNPDGQTDLIECQFFVLDAEPPTVTDVVPPSAFRGVAGDGVSSDATVNLVGSGFQATPAVKWVSVDGLRSYDAQFVGFVDVDQLTAVAPSETLQMAPGQYHVFVTNPDLLGAQWLVDDPANPGTLIPGIFTVTATPPPVIVDVDPARVTGAQCESTPMTVTGAGFDAAATLWWVAPDLGTAGSGCLSPTTDENGNVLCAMAATFVDGGELTAGFLAGGCPPQGSWPIEVRNPDNQSDIFRNVEIRSSNDGHLSSDAFDIMDSQLNTARFKHGAEFGFDVFGRSYLFVAGGQDGSGNALSTIETAQLDDFGNVAPFAIGQQFLDAASPRVDNTLLGPREGVAMVRVGKQLYVIGGTASPTDTTTAVPALDTVEHASILSFLEMPAIKLPQQTAPDGLPTGAWYYSVAAVGPWGESLGSREVVALNVGGTLELCWDAPEAGTATSYNVYRSLASDGRANTGAMIAVGVTDTCFVDDGREALAPAPGRLRGSLIATGALAAGVHSYRVSAVVPLVAGGEVESFAGYPIDVTSDVGNPGIVLNWDAVPGATGYRVYRLDGATQEYVLVAGSPVAVTTFTDEGAAFDASLETPRGEIAPLPPGSLSLWDDATIPAMNNPRDGAEAVVVAMDPATSSPTVGGGMVARIVVAGGRQSSTEGTYLTSAESIGLYADGTVDATWTDEVPQFTAARAYYALVTTQNRNVTPFPPDPEEPPCGDLDNDGFISCACAPADAVGPFDCDDNDGGVFPGAAEVCGDGIDQDCSINGTDFVCAGTDEPCACSTDADTDGFVSEAACGGNDCCDDGSETGSLGCTAGNAGTINPGATDACGNGIDEDCDGQDLPCACMDDLDGDGHYTIACGGDDCCDNGSETILGCTATTAPEIYPGHPDIQGDGVNNDCVPDGVGGPAPGGGGRFGWLGRVTAGAAANATLSAEVATAPVVYDVAGAPEVVELVAVVGDSGFAASNNDPLGTIEGCVVDQVTGLLACGASWSVQPAPGPSVSDVFANEALLYFDFLYGFGGLTGEVTSPTPPPSRNLSGGNIDRFNILAAPGGSVPPSQLPDCDGDANDGAGDNVSNIVCGRESANVNVTINRAYFKTLRLLSYIYVVGGFTSAPTATIERHLQ